MLTHEEISKATAYLTTTREKLCDSVAGLSPEQLHFKPAADCWSIAETLEHVAMVESGIGMLIGSLPDCPPPDAGRVNELIDAQVMEAVPNRTVRIPAPERIQPTGKWTPEQSLQRFQDARAQTIRLLSEAPCLRGHVRPHPVLGLWDGYQWILAAAGHSARHTAQILEVRSCADFPACLAARQG